ncbi:XrtA/PEP-CTERM system TPR-repeat protein PrsT [Alteromonas sp. S167]|uniref:XrtA/PEP-CTERM system TPR-repeat protein PrsT n=1 Tax=Alteromonas sp. S167 TaxID=3117402 RepID=UPI002FE078AE
MSSSKFPIILVSIIPLLFACQPVVDDERVRHEIAREIENKNFNKAEIKIKSLLTENQDDAEMRKLLAEVLYERGNYSASVKEFSYAISLGIDDVDTRVSQLKANLRASNYDEVLSFNHRIYELSAASLAEVYVLKGIAAVRVDAIEDAYTYFNNAIETASDSQFSYMSRAYLASSEENWENALLAINEAINVDSNLNEAYLMKGQVLSNLERFEESMYAYKKYFESRPQSHEAKLIYVNSLIQNNRFDTATPLVAQLSDNFGKHPVISQLKGVLAFVKNDFQNAKIHTDEAIAGGLQTPVSLSINGISAHELGLYEQAYRSLRAAAPNLPEDHPAKKLLFITQTQLGFNEEASETFSGTKFETSDADIVSITGLSLARSGNTEVAEDALQLLMGFDGLSEKSLARRGMLRLQLKDLSGIEDLKAALVTAPQLEGAQVALFDAYLKVEDYDSLIEYAQNLVNDNPQSVTGYNMLARGLVAKGLENKARKAFDKALEIDPINPPSLIFKASELSKKGDFVGAASTIEPLVLNRPSYIYGLKLYYQFLSDAGESEKALRALENAADAAPDSDEHKFLLATVYFAREMIQKSQEQLLNIPQRKSLPNNYWLLLVETYLFEPNWAKAAGALKTWITMDPFNEYAHVYRVALLQQTAQTDTVRVALAEALAALPRSNTLKLLKVQLDIEAGNFAKARSSLKEVERTSSTKTAYDGIEAFFEVLSNESDATSENRLLSFYETYPTKFAVKAIITSYKQLRDKEKLLSFLQKRINDFPRDFFSRKMLADALFTQFPDKAIEHYTLLNKVDPYDLLVINNLAWLLYEKHDLVAASAIINDGLAIRDDVPFILDTAGTIELAKGNNQKAVELFERAYNTSPSPSIIINLASALIETKQEKQARILLEQIPDGIETTLKRKKEKLLLKLQ